MLPTAGDAGKHRWRASARVLRQQEAIEGGQSCKLTIVTPNLLQLAGALAMQQQQQQQAAAQYSQPLPCVGPCLAWQHWQGRGGAGGGGSSGGCSQTWHCSMNPINTASPPSCYHSPLAL